MMPFLGRGGGRGTTNRPLVTVRGRYWEGGLADYTTGTKVDKTFRVDAHKKWRTDQSELTTIGIRMHVTGRGHRYSSSPLPVLLLRKKVTAPM